MREELEISTEAFLNALEELDSSSDELLEIANRISLIAIVAIAHEGVERGKLH